MAKLRSPNYPNFDLGGALALAEKIYSKDGRNKVSRATLASHLGHESLSGPALGKIGALRAYELLEGTGDDLRVSEDAIVALKAPADSQARKEALARLALKPPLFRDVSKEFSTLPSHENLVYWLIRQNFSDAAAAIAAKSYLNTMALVEEIKPDYNPDEVGDVAGSISSQAPQSRPMDGNKVKIMAGERELTTGLLAKDASFRLIVSGNIGVTEIERLIKKLELDKEILADTDDGEEENDVFK